MTAMTELTSKTAQHAQRELELLGEDSGVATSIIEAIEAFFTTYRHSGGSASVAIPLLERLIRGEALTPLTSDPAEWTAMSGVPMWQNRRDSRAVSKDGGQTWWYIEGRHPGERCYDADELGTLVRCQMCGGSGLLHELVLERGPGPQPQESP